MPDVSTAHEFAPAAITALFTSIRNAVDFPLELGGVLGDQAHVYGYHRGRAALPPDDYSVTLPRDRGGRPWAASALDITPHDGGRVQTLTNRLIAAVTRGDERLRPVREFYGTADGRTVYGWDLAEHCSQTADDSHLWHLHLSFHRDVACRFSRLAPVAAVLAGR